MGQKLHCPMYTQDKWEYHDIIPGPMKLKTDRLNMSEGMSLSDADLHIDR